MAGRDVHVVTINNSTPSTHLNRLYRRLAAEAECDRTLTTYINELEIFTRQVTNEHVVGLQGKFEVAHRLDELDMAMAMKEAVFADLRKNIFSPTYQRIAATLLGKIHEVFQAEVRPLIDLNAPRPQIDKAVHDSVVMPIVAELDGCEDFYDVPIQLVRGMLYFLTGNCHIRWH
jgi:hypothetical protein